MGNPRGKRCEQALAHRFHTQRLGPTGKHGADLWTDRFAIEVKSRQAGVAKWMKDGMAQAIIDAKDGRLPIMIIHQHLGLHDDDLVVVRLIDFESLL